MGKKIVTDGKTWEDAKDYPQDARLSSRGTGLTRELALHRGGIRPKRVAFLDFQHALK